jgi:hypothetical protein
MSGIKLHLAVIIEKKSKCRCPAGNVIITANTIAGVSGDLQLKAITDIVL